MFRRLLPFLLIFLLILTDTGILPLYCSHWLIPAFTLISVQCFGLLLGRSRGLLYGLISGLILDILVGTPLGVMTILYAANGYTAGVFMRTFPRNSLTPVLSSVACFVLYELIMAGYVFMINLQFDSNTLLHAFARAGVAVVVTQAFYYFYDWLLKPSKSRFAMR